MSYFTPVTHVVDLGGGNTVTIRKRNYGEQQNIIGNNTKVDPVKGVASVDVAGTRFDELVVAIVSWDGDGFEGRPVTRENILALPEEVVDVIAEAIAALNSPLDSEEKKLFVPDTSGP